MAVFVSNLALALMSITVNCLNVGQERVAVAIVTQIDSERPVKGMRDRLSEWVLQCRGDSGLGSSLLNRWGAIVFRVRSNAIAALVNDRTDGLCRFLGIGRPGHSRVRIGLGV